MPSPVIVLKSAKFGDEFSFTDVSRPLQDKLLSDGNVAVNVDSSLIPIAARASGRGLVKLKGDEIEEIKQTAADMCGASDQTCIEIKMQELTQTKMKEKEAEGVNSANIVKGRRLTAEYTVNGKPMTAVIPEGQQFELGTLADPAAATKGFEPKSLTDPWAPLVSSVWAIIGTSLLTFVYVSSVIITWMTFVKYGNKMLAAGMTALAGFIPYSGFGLSFFAPFIAEYFRIDKLQRLKAVVPEELAAAAVSPLANLSKMGPGVIPPAVHSVLEDPSKLAASMKGGWRILLG